MRALPDGEETSGVLRDACGRHGSCLIWRKVPWALRPPPRRRWSKTRPATGVSRAGSRPSTHPIKDRARARGGARGRGRRRAPKGAGGSSWNGAGSAVPLLHHGPRLRRQDPLRQPLRGDASGPPPRAPSRGGPLRLRALRGSWRDRAVFTGKRGRPGTNGDGRKHSVDARTAPTAGSRGLPSPRITRASGDLGQRCTQYDEGGFPMRTLAPHVHPHLRLQNLRQAEDRQRVRAVDPNEELRRLVSGRCFRRVFAFPLVRRRLHARRARERTKPNAGPMIGKAPTLPAPVARYRSSQSREGVRGPRRRVGSAPRALTFSNPVPVAGLAVLGEAQGSEDLRQRNPGVSCPPKAIGLGGDLSERGGKLFGGSLRFACSCTVARRAARLTGRPRRRPGSPARCRAPRRSRGLPLSPRGKAAGASPPRRGDLRM